MREIVAYIAISVAVLVDVVGSDRLDSSEVQAIPAHHGIRVILVTAAYVAVQAFFFGVKYLVYEHWVFSGRSRFRAALRSRHQVWTAARANRTP